MYAREMGTRDIQLHLIDIYGLSVSLALISGITQRVVEKLAIGAISNFRGSLPHLLF